MGFFKTLLRMNLNRIGNVTGSDFTNCYLSPTKKDNMPALMIYGVGKNDYIFNKADVKEFSIIETGTILVLDGKRYTGNKYRIVFNDGKSALLSIPSGNCQKIEQVLY